MNALAMRIARLIEVQGPISVSQFMTMALHDPVDGYYATHEVIGAAGDFITAPEISQMFGELLGAWIVQIWHDQCSPSPARLVELGPGRGALMGDVLRVAQRAPAFLSGIDIVLVETSETMRQLQAAALEGYPDVRWIRGFDESLSDRPLFVIANEFFDALPIRQFAYTGRAWRERMIGLDAQGNLMIALASDAAPQSIPSQRGRPGAGAVFETCPSGEAMMEQIARVIAGRGGAALIVDYGYGAGAGFGETLQAVARHDFASVLQNPGEADLSAHVDFATLSRSAEKAGAKSYGPISQAALLKCLGIHERAKTLVHANPEQGPEIAAAVERLISPAQMGTLFKALAILPQDAPRPGGF